MTKIKKSYRLTEDTIQKIEQLSVEKNLTHSGAIEFMVEKFFEDRSEEYQKQMNAISDLLDEKLKEMKEDLKRIRVTGNVIDHNIQMVLEFWNHYFIVNDFQELGTTEKYKTEEFKEAEQLIKKRIAHHRQRKLDWESKRKKLE